MDQNIYEQKPNNTRSVAMEITSLILGILALTTCSCLYTSLIFGSLAIIFALLSRGGELTMTARSKTGFWLGIASLILFVGIIGLCIVVVMSYGGIEEFMTAYDALCQQMYGMSFEEMYGMDYHELLEPLQ